MLNEKYLEILEDLGWQYHLDEYGTIEIGQLSPEGENFWMAFRVKNLPEEVEEYYENFDPEEQVAMWLNAKQDGDRSVPDIKTLLEDAEYIQGIIRELVIALKEA